MKKLLAVQGFAKSDVAKMAAKWPFDSERGRRLVSIFWRGRQTTNPIPAH